MVGPRRCSDMILTFIDVGFATAILFKTAFAFAVG
jgi:hypothetical protein